MEKKYIEFNVSGQVITRTDKEVVVAWSRNYLYARFHFLTEEWAGLTPTAIFRSGDKAYEVLLDGDECLVPYEVLENSGIIFVSVFAGDRVTVTKARVDVWVSGYGDDLESSHPPTPSVYEQILERIDDVKIKVEDENSDGNVVITMGESGTS